MKEKQKDKNSPTQGPSHQGLPAEESDSEKELQSIPKKVNPKTHQKEAPSPGVPGEPDEYKRLKEKAKNPDCETNTEE